MPQGGTSTGAILKGEEMKTIGIIPNREKDVNFQYTRTLIDNIHRHGGKVILPADVAAELKTDDAVLQGKSDIDADACICLGGDGTFLKMARDLHRKSIPMMGINLGNLGFLTEIDRNEIENAVNSIFEGNYTIEERMMLEVGIITDGKLTATDTALNDIVISRGAISRILHLKTYVDGVFVDSFPGDGIIISSPTGSTAYSLSAGGPIVEPDMQLMVVTPICPHILYSRSFVTSADKVVRVDVDEGFCHEAMVTVDGQKGYGIRGTDAIEVRKSAHSVRIIRMNSRNFFNILRTKIYYRGEGLKENEV